MKKFYPIQVLITCLVTIISTTVLPAQTFQNTFLCPQAPITMLPE